MNEKRKKRALLCPLDWGLGHAARCIPIITELLRHNAEVIVAADGRALQLLKKEFPQLEFLKFPGVAVQYPNKGSFTVKILLQLPSILKGFFAERKYIDEVVESKNIDVVISDSRHGSYSKKIPSIFIIHQIRILLPKYLKFFEPFVSFVNKKFMERYTECWIPDFEAEHNLTGKLSHSKKLPDNTFFIGPLSRFSPIEKSSVKEIDILAILSGPEPAFYI